MGTFGLGVGAAKAGGALTRGTVGTLSDMITQRRAAKALMPDAPVSATRSAYRALQSRLAADGRPIEQLPAWAAGADPGALLVDAGDRGTHLLANVAQSTPGSRAPRTIRQAIEARARREPAALRSAAEDAVGRGAPDPVAYRAALEDARGTETAPLYEAAHAAAAARFPHGIDTPGIADLLSKPFAADAWRLAQRNAAARGRPLPQAFREVSAPSASGMVDQYGRPLLETRLEPNGRLPDLQALHEFKRALGETYRTNAERGAIGHDAAGAIAQQVGQLQTAIGAALPEYAHANAAYAEHSRRIEAFDQGRADHAQRPDVVASRVAALPAHAVPEYQTGQLARLADDLQSPTGHGGTNARSLDTPAAREHAAAWMPNPEAFTGALDTWLQRRRTADAVLGGSNTADKIEARRDFDAAGHLGNGIENAVRDLGHGNMKGALRGAFDRLTGGALERRRLAANAARADVLGEWLTAGAPGGRDLGPTAAALAAFGQRPRTGPVGALLAPGPPAPLRRVGRALPFLLSGVAGEQPPSAP